MSDLLNMPEPDFDAWLRNQAGGVGAEDDELLAAEVSNVIRGAFQPEAKAERLLNVANMCIAMADKILGCQVPVATCLELTRH